MQVAALASASHHSEISDVEAPSPVPSPKEAQPKRQRLPRPSRNLLHLQRGLSKRKSLAGAAHACWQAICKDIWVSHVHSVHPRPYFPPLPLAFCCAHGVPRCTALTQEACRVQMLVSSSLRVIGGARGFVWLRSVGTATRLKYMRGNMQVRVSANYVACAAACMGVHRR
jgi:hypothetical protein